VRVKNDDRSVGAKRKSWGEMRYTLFEGKKDHKFLEGS
jgi:hypothetical protein